MRGFELQDHSQEVLNELERRTAAALEAIGIKAEDFAKTEARDRPVPANSWYTRTGRLVNSISHRVQDDSVYIGTNLTYAPYVELGTGIYASDGNGRKDAWWYKGSDGEWHKTRGIRASHFLKKAASEHTSEYKRIAKQALES